MLCVQRNTCNDFIYGEFGTYPRDIDIKVKMINDWSRLINDKHGKISYVMPVIPRQFWIVHFTLDKAN